MAKILEENSLDNRRIFISPIMNIPPLQIDDTYSAVAVFTIRRSMLESILTFLVIGRDDTKGSLHGMPNFSVGHSDIIDDQIQKIYLYTENFLIINFLANKIRLLAWSL